MAALSGSVFLFLLLAVMPAQQISTSHYHLTTTAEIGLFQSIPEFNKRPRLNRTLDIRNISQTKVHQLLILLLSQPADEAIARQCLSKSYSRQAIFSEAEIEEAGDGDRGCAELFLLFDEIGAANEAYGAFMAEGGEELKHFGGDGLGTVFSVSYQLERGFRGMLHGVLESGCRPHRRDILCSLWVELPRVGTRWLLLCGP